MTDSDKEFEFVQPKQEVRTLQGLARWNNSQAYRDFTGFIFTLNETMKGKSLLVECEVSTPVQNIINMLETLSTWVDEIPACEQPMRFGNKSFRTWAAKLEENSESLILTILPESWKSAVVELKPYLNDSFGNKTRIDYGTGHEAFFILFLCCLYKLQVLKEADQLAIVCKIFTKYLDLVRKLQQTYRMEPAGSQGVWGLDDFQFVPYIWGSNQLNDHPNITPSAIPDANMSKRHKNEYLFFDCIEYINSMKTGPFAEHSNVLWGISAVPYWGKVNSGLIKMYKAEVLSKFPIIQHFVFGTLLSIERAT